ncbi:MAG: 1-acyl-sn-glycerol-3-phosphate acyltransferase [Flavobacteriales bacterium]|jgi:1-acyl-sn-glycerol-3-phosphate acyltransferase|nr:1-acyl-sn-glycerol-3-phosphate acyltransferase [Flavobacteriales bacterium]MCB0759332.1 1-acyl-sn-glycerol-3-phosphate acyltransferase [Flavobacteriales bacterium]
MWSSISLGILKLAGWRVIDRRPADLGSAIYLVVPHTSNWDFLVGLLARSGRKIKANYLAKKSLFDSPLGWLFRALGGFPVDRSKSTNITDQVVEYFNTVPGFSIAITPEGTRSKVDAWKTGFWRIAHKAKVPLVLTSFDYSRKEVVLSEPYHVGDDMETDIAALTEYFKPFVGKNPN